MTKREYIYLIILIIGIGLVFQGINNIGISFLAILMGLYVLLQGGDFLVDGSGSIAKLKKIPPIVIGLTVISFGTSAPEFFVNVLAAFKSQTDLLISNIIGSNLSNLLLILGLAAIIAKGLKVQNNTLYREIPFSFLAVMVLIFLANDLIIDGINFRQLGWEFANYITRIDGLILLSFFVIFLYYVFSISKNGNIQGLEEINQYGWNKSIVLILLGILGLYVGGELVVSNAKFIAQQLGISQILIGSTIVAIGTSLPELVASLIAAIKKQADMAVGNIIGSNIFNIFWIGGASALISPVGVQKSLNIDMVILLVSTFIVFISVYFTKKRNITPIVGIVLVGLYIGYLCFTILRG